MCYLEMDWHTEKGVARSQIHSHTYLLARDGELEGKDRRMNMDGMDAKLHCECEDQI